MRIPRMKETLLLTFLICSCFQYHVTQNLERCLSHQGVTIKQHFFVDQYDLPLKIGVTSRTSHQLVSHILRYLLNEVIGYEKVEFVNLTRDTATHALHKLSNCESPEKCLDIGHRGPEVMINMEVPVAAGFNMEGWVSSDRVVDCGPLGPIGRSGWFIAESIVEMFWKGNNTIIDHYRAFLNPYIALRFDLTNDPMIVRDAIKTCQEETKPPELECSDGFFRPPQCLQQNISCATILSDYPEPTFQILRDAIMKYKLLVNIAWIGKTLETAVEKRTVIQKNTLFYHRKPMILSSIGNFSSIAFPGCEDEQPNCEFQVNQLQKVVWSKVKSDAPYAFHVIRAIHFRQRDYLALLNRYYEGIGRNFKYETVACNWIRENILLWDKWIPNEAKQKTSIYIGGIFPLTGIYKKQSSVIEAARLAAEAINRNNTLLEDYDIQILSQDGQCAADEVMNSFINYMINSTYRTMVGILGPACSDTVEPIAGVAKHFNTIIISYSAEGASFSNREKYPYFFRTIPENNQFRFVYLKLFKTLGYKRIAALTEEGQKYPEYISYLHELMEFNEMTFITNKKFPREKALTHMKIYLEDLKSKGAKIIIGDFYDYAARAIMCTAYELGMTASNGYVWFLPVFYPRNWYDTDKLRASSNDDDEDFEAVTCTTEQMVEAINGHMSLTYNYYADSNSIMQENKTVREWKEIYRKKSLEKHREVSIYGGFSYDAVWVYAYALDALLKEDESNVATLHQKKTTRRLMEHLNRTNFTGVTGPLYFVNASRVSDVIILQWLNSAHHVVGIYKSYSLEDGELELNESNIKWLTPDGRKPDDGSIEYGDCDVEVIRKLFGSSCGTAKLVLNVSGIGTFVILVGIISLAFKRRYERRMKNAEKRMKELGLMSKDVPYALDAWELRREHIVINRKLGEGAFGSVFGGEAEVKKDVYISVAVKTLKKGAKTEEKLDFLNEAEIMKKFDHVNIVKLIGVCTTEEPVYTVMEFMLYGDLKTYLLSRRNLATEKERCNNDEVSDRRLTNMALDIARGLSYLADLKYIHRDLACRNCLVNAIRTVKIADFGMCRAMYDSDYYRYNKRGMLPIRWMAPESLFDGMFTAFSDIWSYGVVLYEIITFASFPYQGMSHDQVLAYVKSNRTLPVPKGCKPELETLLKRCWSSVPYERPPAAEIVEILGQAPELITPCVDVPSASVALEDTGNLQIKGHDRNRIQSLSSVWQHRRNTLTNEQQGVFDTSQVYQSDLETVSVLKPPGAKHPNKKSLHESLKKIKKEHKEKSADCFTQVTKL